MKYPNLPKPQGYTWQLNQHGHNVREENDCFTEDQMYDYALKFATQNDLVLRITTAYEQGFGHALRTELSNPYQEGTLEAEAWDNGREVGKRKQVEPTDPYLKTVFAELYAQDSRSYCAKIGRLWEPNEWAETLLEDQHEFLKLVYFAGRNSK